MKIGEELFSTSKGSSYQCDRSNRVILCFGDLVTAFRIHEFVNFRRRINSIDIQSKLFDLSDECDYEVIEAPQQALPQRMALCEVIQLRELVNGTHFALELNSLLHEVLYSSCEV
ncbi:hypothetical protein GCM10027275_37170 [Rhabdobacter roseus]|uniref:Uncharacterized protein n=1 Tax=Rhabdobacter roseus TaxID=1655419 RepID=A0A840TNM2_9BACT|nr:hypothetical protein [Rhabdobacter roseus]MBB5285876.1 hypothetical protein [Rhabdobacter roseus]